jgi:ATP-dependent exoDNAse (exonuclease V) beta subunit
LGREAAADGVSGPDLLEPLETSADGMPLTVTGEGLRLATASDPADRTAWPLDSQGRLMGTIVHRLLQSSPPDDERLQEAIRGAVEAIAREEGITEERSALAERVATLYRTMRCDGLEELLASGTALFELPFSIRLSEADARRLGLDGGTWPAIVRGTMDCLVLTAAGEAIVVEFKTGARRVEHQRQLDLYLEAARRMFPRAAVSGRLVYPSPIDPAADTP